MARTVKPEEYAQKRNEILDAALRQMLAKGYNKVAIQDILKEINISGGAFYHYFESRDALLGALILRILQRSEKQILMVVEDPHLSAIEKLRDFFSTLDQMRILHREDIVRIERIWYSDENAIVRKKMDEAVIQQRGPMVNRIAEQGVREGVFNITYPNRAGEIILSLLQGMGNTHISLLIYATQASEDEISGIAENIVATHAAYMEAIERVLGAPANCLYRADCEVAMQWITALREGNQ